MTANLESLSDHQLFERLLTTDAEDYKIKPILNRRRRGAKIGFIRADDEQPALRAEATVNGNNPDDTALTALVRKAYREGYRGEHTDDPGVTVKYMLQQIDRNLEESEIDFEPIRKFWALWRDRYSEWRVDQGLVQP